MKTLKRGVRPFLAMALCIAAWTPASAVLSGEQILKHVDDIRMPQGDFTTVAQLESSKPGAKSPPTSRYEVYYKGREKTLIKTLEPATDRGTSYLRVDPDFWVFLANVSKPIRISMQERLTGEASNGDIALANFSGDYDVSIEKVEAAFFVLKLTAKNEDKTYGSIRLWVDRNNYHPLKAQFFAFSGRLLKVGSYEDYRTLAGASRPSKLVLVNAIDKAKVTTITYEKMAPHAEMPEKMFTKDYLKKLKY